MGELWRGNPSPGRRRWALAGAAAAVASPLLMWAEFLTFGWRTPGYNLLLRAASDLGAAGAPGRDLYTTGFFLVPGVLTTVFGLALLRLLPAGPAALWGSFLVVAEGVLLFLAGLFPENRLSPAAEAEHQLFSSLSYLAAAVAPLLVGWAAHPRLAAFRRASVVTGGLLLAVYGLAAVARGFGPIPEGLFQRPFGVALTVWFLLAAVALLGLARVPEASEARPDRPSE